MGPLSLWPRDAIHDWRSANISAHVDTVRLGPSTQTENTIANQEAEGRMLEAPGAPPLSIQSMMMMFRCQVWPFRPFRFSAKSSCAGWHVGPGSGRGDCLCGGEARVGCGLRCGACLFLGAELFRECLRRRRHTGVPETPMLSRCICFRRRKNPFESNFRCQLAKQSHSTRATILTTYRCTKPSTSINTL